MFHRLAAAVAVLVVMGAAPGASAQQAATATPTGPERLAPEIAAFEAQDRAAPPERCKVVFTGSSSVRFWSTLAQDMAPTDVINRGFGGSEIRDSTWYAGRIVVPYAPRQVVLYAGDNDLSSGRSPVQLRDDFRAFVQRVRRDLPKAKIAYLSNKPSPSRAHLLDLQRQANALIAADAAGLQVDFIDIFSPMLDAQGQPREELFLQDRLHMNPAGYALWKQALLPYLDRDAAAP